MPPTTPWALRAVAKHGGKTKGRAKRTDPKIAVRVRVMRPRPGFGTGKPSRVVFTLYLLAHL